MVSMSPMTTTATSKPMKVKPRCVPMSSPGSDWRSVRGGFRGAAVDITNARMIRIVRGDQCPRVREPGERIDRHLADITLLDEHRQGLRVFVEIGIVFVDRLTEHRQVMLQHRFARALQRAEIPRYGEAQQGADDRHHDEQLDQGEAGLRVIRPPRHREFLYQSRYATPFNPFAVDSE